MLLTGPRDTVFSKRKQPLTNAASWVEPSPASSNEVSRLPPLAQFHDIIFLLLRNKSTYYHVAEHTDTTKHLTKQTAPIY